MAVEIRDLAKSQKSFLDSLRKGGNGFAARTNLRPRDDPYLSQLPAFEIQFGGFPRRQPASQPLVIARDARNWSRSPRHIRSLWTRRKSEGAMQPPDLARMPPPALCEVPPRPSYGAVACFRDPSRRCLSIVPPPTSAVSIPCLGSTAAIFAVKASRSARGMDVLRLPLTLQMSCDLYRRNRYCRIVHVPDPPRPCSSLKMGGCRPWDLAWKDPACSLRSSPAPFPTRESGNLGSCFGRPAARRPELRQATLAANARAMVITSHSIR
jgi:hypothetical protein